MHFSESPYFSCFHGGHDEKCKGFMRCYEVWSNGAIRRSDSLIPSFFDFVNCISQNLYIFKAFTKGDDEKCMGFMRYYEVWSNGAIRRSAAPLPGNHLTPPLLS